MYLKAKNKNRGGFIKSNKIFLMGFQHENFPIFFWFFLDFFDFFLIHSFRFLGWLAQGSLIGKESNFNNLRGPFRVRLKSYKSTAGKRSEQESEMI